jgi:flagellin-like protein
MMKFFRKHKKAVSPVIAVMLLVAVAVAAVGAYLLLLGELTMIRQLLFFKKGDLTYAMEKI